MKELVRYIAENLVDQRDRVRVREIRTSHSTVVELRVARSDMGRVIGKEGRVANAIRAVLRVPAARQGKEITLDIV